MKLYHSRFWRRGLVFFFEFHFKWEWVERIIQSFVDFLINSLLYEIFIYLTLVLFFIVLILLKLEVTFQCNCFFLVEFYRKAQLPFDLISKLIGPHLNPLVNTCEYRPLLWRSQSISELHKKIFGVS